MQLLHGQHVISVDRVDPQGLIELAIDDFDTAQRAAVVLTIGEARVFMVGMREVCAELDRERAAREARK